MHTNYSVLPTSECSLFIERFQIICSGSSLFHTNRHLSIETRYFAHAVNSLSKSTTTKIKKKKNEINRENGVFTSTR